MENKQKYLKYKEKYLKLKKLIGGAKPLKPIPEDWKLHFVPKFRTTHIGNGKSYTSDIINQKSCMGYTFYETGNSIYYHPGVARAFVECDCWKRNHSVFLK